MNDLCRTERDSSRIRSSTTARPATRASSPPEGAATSPRGGYAVRSRAFLATREGTRGWFEFAAFSTMSPLRSSSSSARPKQVLHPTAFPDRCRLCPPALLAVMPLIQTSGVLLTEPW